MTDVPTPLILCVDDDHDTLALIERFLRKGGYQAITVDGAKKALQKLGEVKPDLILLDIVMPEMDGYEFCAELQKREDWAFIPVVFLTAQTGEQDKARAFSLGAVDYITKPTSQENLNTIIAKHLKTRRWWNEIQEKQAFVDLQEFHPDFNKFKVFLLDKLSLPEEQRGRIRQSGPHQIYSMLADTDIPSRQLAKLVAEFLQLEYTPLINPDSIQLGVLPTAFCKKKYVVPVKEAAAGLTFVLSNPFDWELLDILGRHSQSRRRMKFIITEPENIKLLLEYDPAIKKLMIGEDKKQIVKPIPEILAADIEKHPVVYISNNILDIAVSERASDIHIEPKQNKTVVRFRIDGDLREFYNLEKDAGVMVISRFKAIAGLDITEKRKPQDGAFAATIANRYFKLRVATTSTSEGESAVIRILEPGVKAKELHELGMTDRQAAKMRDFANKSHGLVMIVGPTGSGKTTTVYSFLTQIDYQRQSLISVEDPVEYRIPFANQQQVNVKAGVTFETLLKSAVRQDPDILFVGEVRDPYSAKMAMDFASTGHLTVTTLHTSNTTTAIFRLERLEISRGTMADALLGTIAQRLIRKLCPHCKKIVNISAEESEMLSPFTSEIISHVAHPVGCPKCNNTGYFGREGVYEIMEFDAEVVKMARSGVPISEIRSFIQARGDYLISHHTVEKVKQLLFSPAEAYEKVLAEEISFGRKTADAQAAPVKTIKEETGEGAVILVVEDDQSMQKLITRHLEMQGYKVTIAQDGVDALINLGRGDFDLILSDINMPNLDGFKLLEMLTQKGVHTPVIFLSGRSSPEDEMKGLALGASDYIKKPIQKEILLFRVKKALERFPPPVARSPAPTGR